VASFTAAARRSGYRRRHGPNAADRWRPQYLALESGHRPVSGPAWVAPEDQLRKSNEIALADKVAQVVCLKSAECLTCDGVTD
jgi:hypothetical protein